MEAGKMSVCKFCGFRVRRGANRKKTKNGWAHKLHPRPPLKQNAGPIAALEILYGLPISITAAVMRRKGRKYRKMPANIRNLIPTIDGGKATK